MKIILSLKDHHCSLFSEEFSTPRYCREEIIKLRRQTIGNKREIIKAEVQHRGTWKEIPWDDQSSQELAIKVMSIAKKINPEEFQKQVNEIPPGIYCYHGKQYCPHLKTKTFNGVDIPWCGFLEEGTMPNGITETEIEKLIEHFGNEKAMEQATSLLLLWDACKECGINDDLDQ